MFRLLFLGNGWTDCAEILYALRAPLVTAYAVVTGRLSLHVLTCRGTPPPHTALLYLGNGLADCVQIWYVGWWSLTKCLPQVIGGVHLHVRTCAPLFHKCSACRHSVTVGPIALKFGMLLETHYLQLMQQSRMGYLCTCARAHRASVSQERLGRLSSILVRELGVMN